MAIDQILHRLRKTLLEFRLEPLRRLGIDRVSGNDALGRDGKDRVVVIVAEAIDFTGDLGNLAYRRLGRGPGGQKDQQHCPDTDTAFQALSVHVWRSSRTKTHPVRL